MRHTLKALFVISVIFAASSSHAEGRSSGSNRELTEIPVGSTISISNGAVVVPVGFEGTALGASGDAGCSVRMKEIEPSRRELKNETLIVSKIEKSIQTEGLPDPVTHYQIHVVHPTIDSIDCQSRIAWLTDADGKAFFNDGKIRKSHLQAILSRFKNAKISLQGPASSDSSARSPAASSL